MGRKAGAGRQQADIQADRQAGKLAGWHSGKQADSRQADQQQACRWVGRKAGGRQTVR